MSSTSLAAESQIEVLSNVRFLNYFNVASVVILVYDYSLTFESEVVHIWSHSFSFITLLFLITRYLPFLDIITLLIHAYLPTLSVSSYTLLFKLQVWSVTIGIALGTMVLVLRTCAIWNNVRKVILTLSFIDLAVVVVSFYFVAVFLSSLRFEKSTSAAISGFFVAQANSDLIVPYISVLLFETIVLILTVFKATAQRKESQLYRTLYRDSLVFYVYIFAVSLVNIIILITAAGELKPVLTELHRILSSILLCRIILNIRDAMALSGGSVVPSSSGRSDCSTFLLGDSWGEVPIVLDIGRMGMDEEDVELEDLNRGGERRERLDVDAGDGGEWRRDVEEEWRRRVREDDGTEGKGWERWGEGWSAADSSKAGSRV